MTRIIRIFVTAVGLVFLVPCCTVKPPETPEEVYRAFYDAVSVGEWDLAMTYLSPETLAAFRQGFARLMRSNGLTVPKEDPLELFLRGVRAQPTVPLRGVDVASRERDAVVLQVTAGPCAAGGPCSVTRVKAVRRADSWMIAPELPPLLLSGSSLTSER